MTATRLDIHRPSPDSAIVTLRGEHEGYTASRLERELSALAAAGCAIEVDLTHAAFIDSETAGVLLAAQRHAEEEDRAFQVTLGPETGWSVRRLLEVTGLGNILRAAERGASS